MSSERKAHAPQGNIKGLVYGIALDIQTAGVIPDMPDPELGRYPKSNVGATILINIMAQASLAEKAGQWVFAFFRKHTLFLILLCAKQRA
jgi:hypothetical protein